MPKTKKRSQKKASRTKTKSNERFEALFRILVLIITGVILNIWLALIQILVLVNWIITLISGERNKEVAEFCEYWNTEKYRFIRYLTFVSNERPFPFNNIKRISKFS